MYLEITYYNTLYKRNTKVVAAGTINYKNGCAIFHAGGHSYSVDASNIRKIEAVKD